MRWEARLPFVFEGPRRGEALASARSRRKPGSRAVPLPALRPLSHRLVIHGREHVQARSIAFVALGLETGSEALATARAKGGPTLKWIAIAGCALLALEGVRLGRRAMYGHTLAVDALLRVERELVPRVESLERANRYPGPDRIEDSDGPPIGQATVIRYKAQRGDDPAFEPKPALEAIRESRGQRGEG